jgi:hypothetical protein
MEMVRQHDNRVDRERMPQPRISKCGPQRLDMIGEQPQPAFG